MASSRLAAQDRVGTLEYRLSTTQAQCNEQAKFILEINQQLNQVTKKSNCTLKEYESLCQSLINKIKIFSQENDISVSNNKMNELSSIATGYENVSDEQFDAMLNEISPDMEAELAAVTTSNSMIDTQDTTAVLIANTLEEESKYDMEPGATPGSMSNNRNKNGSNDKMNELKKEEIESKEAMLQLKEDLKTVDTIFNMFFDGISDIVITCDQDHRLLFTTHEELQREHPGYSNGYACNECRAVFETKESMHCKICRFDLCRKCSLIKINEKKSKLMSLSVKSKQIEHLAKILYSKYKINKDTSILEEKNDEIKNDEQMKIDLTCDKGHNLTKTNVETLISQHNGYVNGFICDECEKMFKSEDKNSGSYHCIQCLFDLCDNCHNERKDTIISKAKETVRNRIQNQQDSNQNSNNNNNNNGMKNVSGKDGESDNDRKEEKSKQEEKKKEKPIIIRCDQKHVLSKLHSSKLAKDIPGYSHGFVCENCGKSKNNETVYHCLDGCYFDLCQSCYDDAVREAKEYSHIEDDLYLNCNNNHKLQSIRPKDLKKLHTGYRYGFNCDECGKTYQHSRVWHCQDCFYDLCRSCYHNKLIQLYKNYDALKKEGSETRANENDIKFIAKCGKCPEKYELILCSHNDLVAHSKGYMYGFVCNVCRRSYPKQNAYHCKECTYDLCESCYNSQKMDFIGKSGKIITKFTSESKVDSGGSNDKSSGGDNDKEAVTCDKYHKLKLFKPNELYNDHHAYGAGFVCNECRITYDNSDAWHCTPCFYDLCTACYEDRLHNIIMLNAEFDDSQQIEGSLSLYDTNDDDSMECPRCQVPSRTVKLTTHDEMVQESSGYKHGFICNICRATFKEKQNSYHCKHCTYDLCKRCFTLKKKGSTIMCPRCKGACDCALTTPQQLRTKSQGYKNGYICDGCRKLKKNENAYHCMRCNYDLCQGCFDERRLEYLHFAVSMNDLVLVKRLVLHNDWDVNKLNNKGQTPLYIAWKSDDSHASDERIVRFLLNQGGYCGNYRDPTNNYCTMLHGAAKENESLMVRSLLQNGSNLKITDKNGDTAIYYAIDSGNGELVKFLCYVLTTKVKDCDEMLKLLNCKRLMDKCVEKGYNDMQHFFKVLESSLKEGRMKTVRNVIADNRRKKDKIFEKYLDLKKQTKENRLLLKYLDNRSKDGILNAVMKLLELKLPIDDSVLMLCFNHLTSKDAGAMLHNGKQSAASIRRAKERSYKLDQLVNLLKSTVQSSLTQANETKKRDYLWFQKYLLDSNMWFVKYHDRSLFEEICKVLNGELVMQQKHLKSCFIEQFMLKSDNYYWIKLLSFEEYIAELQGPQNGGKSNKEAKSFENETSIVLRQDKIENGLYSNVKKSDLFVSLETGFDGSEQYDLNVYLTNLLIRSHAINVEFQSQMKQIFSSKQYGIECGQFQPAPVKQANRCQIKAQTDYREREWPRTACVLDTIRCSITFNTSRDMIESIEKFEKVIKSGRGGCVKQILRVKNLFSIYKKSILDQASTTDEHTRIVQSMPLSQFQYCDIKFNVLIERNGEAIIGEVQFLIKFMLEAKIMGHNLYSVIRRREFVDDVLNAAQEERKSDPAMLVVRKDYSEFCNQLLLNDAGILSVGNVPSSAQDPPVLYLSLKAGWNKASKLFYDALVHFDKANDLKNQFVEKYLSHPMLKEFSNHPLLNRQESKQEE